MKYKLIDSGFNKDTLESYVTIDTKYGKITGRSRCCPDDKPSRYTGCNVAELRAIRKMLITDKKFFLRESKALQDYRKRMESTRIYAEDPSSYYIISLDNEIMFKQNKIKELETQIKWIDEYIGSM